MNTFRAFSFCTALLYVLMMPSVQATTVGECADQIQTLEQQLDGVEVGGNNPDRTRASLESKLSGSLTKLDQAKFCDAILKLAQFRDKVQDLAVPNRKGETKMNADDAYSLATSADEAIVCIRDLDSSCP
jgi:hypothetical protein